MMVFVVLWLCHSRKMVFSMNPISKKRILKQMFSNHHLLIFGGLFLLFFSAVPFLRASDLWDGLRSQRAIVEGVYGVDLGRCEDDPSSTDLSDSPAMSSPFSGGAVGGASPSLQG